MTRRRKRGCTVYGLDMLSSTALHRLVSLLVLLIPSNVFAQMVTCRDGSGGYDNVDNLNRDIDSEATRIADGGTPQAAYMYIICPGTTIIMDGKSLKPKLEGSVFQCGNGTRPGSCRFHGGVDQVVVEKSAIPDYIISDVRFSAITFTGFSNSVLSGSAASTITVTFERCSIQVRSFTSDQDRTWPIPLPALTFIHLNQDAVSRFVINQSKDGSDGPFSVNLFDTSLRNITAGVVLSSDGGNTIVQESSFLDIKAMALGSVSNSGVMLVNELNVKGGEYEVSV